MKRDPFIVSATLLLLAWPAAAQREMDTSVLQRIRAEAAEHSEVLSIFDQFVTVIGPRLTGSPEFKAAAAWALDAHLDSWHTGTGATDNAGGSAAVMEAMRILKTTGARPRRTIRVALWGGEEEGDANKGARDRVAVYLNIEAGIGATDHVAFRNAGLPGFNAVQDYDTYDVRTHHTNVDTYERIRAQDLKQNAIVLAWIAYSAAVTDQKFPRPEPRVPR